MPDSFDILIKKFIANKCTEEEAEVVVDRLLREPSLIEKYMPEKEWEQLVQAKNASVLQIIKNRIQNSVFKKVSEKRFSVYLKYASVACIVFAVLLTSYFYSAHDNEVAPLGQTYSAIQNTGADKYNTLANNSNSEKHISLPDGSVVILTPGSVIHFNKSFLSKRNIFLEGNAYFIVAKDKENPFTVFENGIAVTALGTEFWVKNDRETNSVSVYLHEGKVLIKPHNNTFSFKQVVLYPGQDFTVNNLDKITILNLNKPSSTINNSKEKYVKEFSQININDEFIEFNYTPIEKVVKTLEGYFDVNIHIEKNKNIIKNEFTGTVFLKDSLQVILGKISEMNDAQFKVSPKKAAIHESQYDNIILQKPAPINTLKKDSSLSYNSISETSHKENSKKSASEVNITRDYIFFQYTPLNELFKTLANYYGQEIEYRSSKTNEFTGKVYHNIPLEKFINNICKINNLQYTKKNNKIIIYE